MAERVDGDGGTHFLEELVVLSGYLLSSVIMEMLPVVFALRSSRHYRHIREACQDDVIPIGVLTYGVVVEIPEEKEECIDVLLRPARLERVM